MGSIKIKIMSVIEIKVEMATAILSDIDEVRIAEMKKLYNKLYKSQSSDPCIYSVEELQESLIAVERDFAEGKGISSEELRKRHARV